MPNFGDWGIEMELSRLRRSSASGLMRDINLVHDASIESVFPRIGDLPIISYPRNTNIKVVVNLMIGSNKFKIAKPPKFNLAEINPLSAPFANPTKSTNPKRIINQGVSASKNFVRNGVNINQISVITIAIFIPSLLEYFQKLKPALSPYFPIIKALL